MSEDVAEKRKDQLMKIEALFIHLRYPYVVKIIAICDCLIGKSTAGKECCTQDFRTGSVNFRNFQESGHSQFHMVKKSEDVSNVSGPMQTLRLLQCNSGI